MPWFKPTSVRHPIYRQGSYDISPLAWCKFGDAKVGKFTLPFSVQAHHGFVDGHHIDLPGRDNRCAHRQHHQRFL